MNRDIEYDPLSYQEKFHESVKPKVYLSTGYGGGKTYSLVMKMLQLCSINAGFEGGLLCPTLKMFKRDVLPTIRTVCRENGIPYKFHKTDFYFRFKTTGSTIYVFHGEDDGESIRGPNLAFMCINECSLLSKATFDAALARVRVKDADLLQIAMSGTPEEFNWVYEYFLEEPRDDTEFIFGDMRENKYIAESYAEMLVDSYDAAMVEQYVEGKYVSLKGKRAAYAFDRRIHTRKAVKKAPIKPIWISIDFNVDPMSAVLWNRMGPDCAYALQAFDEICIPGSDTYELCDAINEKITPDDYVVIYPDPAGKARSTKTRGKTDIDILKKHGKFENIKHKSRIQSVRDCLNALNNLLSKDKIMISTACKNLIADLEQCKIKEGTFEIDKSNPKRSHWLDGLKNMVDYEFPIRTKSQHWVRQIR